MSETRVEILILQRLQQEQKEANGRLEKIAERLGEMERRIAEVKGEVAGLSKPRTDVHWSVRNVLAPLLVAAIVALAGLAYHGLDTRLGNVEAFLRGNGGFIAAIRLENVNPSDPQRAQEAEQILAQAKKAEIKISPEVIEKAGKKFIDAAKNDPAVWNAALAFVDYRSFLNVNTEPQLKNPLPIPDVEQHYFITNFTVHRPAFSVYGHAPVSQAAKLNLIGKAEPSPPYGHAFILLVGDSVIIDDLEMKNVVFRDVHVIYLGGNFIMENVYFVNCTFEIVQQPNGQHLANSVLASSPLSISEPKPS
ncbi:MAG: hypothetical protein ACLPVW_14435 [Terriglobales bacterium]